MSPRTIIAIVVWVLCLCGLYFGLKVWGSYVEERDRARRASDALVLQRGDLPTDYQIGPSDVTDSVLFSSLIASTAAQHPQAVSVVRYEPAPFHAELLYLDYADTRLSGDPVRRWQQLLHLPSSTEIAVTAHGELAAVWRRDGIVVVAMSGGDPPDHAAMAKLMQAADARIARWQRGRP